MDTPPPSSPPRGASSQVQSAVPSVQAPAPPPVYTFEKHIARDVYLDLIRKNYPDLDVANLSDFDLIALSSGGYDGSPAGIQQWLQDELDAVAELEGGDVKVILEEATVACNEIVSAIGVSLARLLSIPLVAEHTSDQSAQAFHGSDRRYHPTCDGHRLLHAPLACLGAKLVF